MSATVEQTGPGEGFRAEVFNVRKIESADRRPDGKICRHSTDHSVIAVKEAQTLRPPRGSCGVPFAISPQRKEADTHAKKQQEKSAKLRRLLNVIYNSSRFVRQPRVY